jgi:hypothetical protein
MPSGQQDKEFASEMEDNTTITVSTSALDNAIEWIGKNLSPDDVFSDKDLSSWAESNGYVKE